MKEKKKKCWNNTIYDIKHLEAAKKYLNWFLVFLTFLISSAVYVLMAGMFLAIIACYAICFPLRLPPIAVVGNSAKPKKKREWGKKNWEFNVIRC